MKSISQSRLRFALATLVILAAMPSFASMKARFEGKNIIVTGVTPGAKTVWMAVTYEQLGYHPRVTDRSAVVVDDDRDGVVQLSLERVVPGSSVWAIVDTLSGDHVVETPPAAHVRRVPLAPGALHKKGNGSRASIENAAELMAFWCVRPGVGAWKSVVEDGAAEDAGSALDGKLIVALGAMIPVDGSMPPPDDFQRGDVIIAIDLTSLDAYDLRVLQ